MTETAALASAMAALSASPTAPKAVRETAAALADRIGRPHVVRVLSMGVPKTAALKDKLLSRTDGTEFTFDFGDPSAAACGKDQQLKGTTVIIATNPMDQIEDKIRQWQNVGFNNCVLWTPTSGPYDPPYKFGFHSSDESPDAVMQWLLAAVRSGKDADLTTATFLSKKYKVEPSADQIQPATPIEPNVAQVAKPLAPVDTKDAQSMLRWSLSAFDDLASRRPKNADPLQEEDFWSAQDQLTLLDLEGTEHAAKTALCIILQLRNKIEPRCSDKDPRHLPNLKLAAAS